MNKIINALVPIDAIKPHPRNYRSHPEQQLTYLQASHERFGQYRSVVLWSRPRGKYVTVAGHGIIEAMRQRGVTEIRADVLPQNTPQTEIDAILIADNNIAQHASDDDALLAQLLQEQQNAGYALAALGSDDETLRQMLASLGDGYAGEQEEGEGGDDYEVSPDEVEIRCKRGELWQLGKHRLLVDDATKPENVKRLMQGEKAVLMATDPPYGDSWVQKAKDMQAHGYVHSRAVLHGSIASDDLPERDLKAFLIAFLGAAKHAGDAPMPIYVWHGAKRIVFETALVEAGYFVHQPIVWVKPGFVIGRLHYHPRCEWALHGWRQGNGACPFYGERNQSDVWEVDRENDKIHPTQKPLQLFETPLLNHTKPDEICYEPFAGSGTQIIAAERLGRRCYAMEIDERYATVCLNRYEAETGRTATLLSRHEEAVHA